MIKKITVWLSNLKQWWLREQCYRRMEYNNKAAMGYCSGLYNWRGSIRPFWFPCNNCQHFTHGHMGKCITKGLQEGLSKPTRLLIKIEDDFKIDVNCDTCSKHHTMDCPNSSLCYSLSGDKPYWSPKTNIFKIKVNLPFNQKAMMSFKFWAGDHGELIIDSTLWPNEYIYKTHLTLEEVYKIPGIILVEDLTLRKEE